MTEEELAAEIVAAVDRELDEDVVGLWMVPNVILDSWPKAPPEEVLRVASKVLTALLAKEVSVGDLNETTGAFSPWPAGEQFEQAIAWLSGPNRNPGDSSVAWLGRIRAS